MYSTLLNVFVAYIIICISLSAYAVPIQRTAYLGKRSAANNNRNLIFLLHPRARRSWLKSNFNSLYPTQHGSRRRREDEYDKYDGQDDADYNYPPGFYPYRNVGSLFVDGKNVEIEKSLYNYGVDTYPYPQYGPPEAE